MEENINIEEILRNKPHGVKLYSPIFGECAFCYVREDTNDICVKKHNGVKEYFNSEGLYFALGEVMLFPSKSIRDWEKFSWKRGDVLISNCGFVCIFKEWASDDYTRFNGCYFDGMPNAETAKYSKLDNNTAYGYIRELEKRCGGTLNLETLKIEKTNPKFNDGDVLFVKCNDSAFIEIFEYSKKNGDLCDHASLDITNQILDISGKYTISKDEITELRIATEEEKKQLFSALANKGKAWDSEKKKVVNLKPKVEFKPMDLCLMKYIGQYNNRGWELCQYAYTEHRVSSSGEQRDFYHAVGGEIYAECIPYNEDTKHLLGTKTEWKGGKGMKISELIKLLEARKKQFGNIDVVDDLGYITNDLIYNEDDNSLMIVTDTFRKVRRNGKD